MNSEQYDQLLESINVARKNLEYARDREHMAMRRLDYLLRKLDEEEHRIAQQALIHMPIASRKLVVGE